MPGQGRRSVREPMSQLKTMHPLVRSRRDGRSPRIFKDGPAFMIRRARRRETLGVQPPSCEFPKVTNRSRNRAMAGGSGRELFFPVYTGMCRMNWDPSIRYLSDPHRARNCTGSGACPMTGADMKGIPRLSGAVEKTRTSTGFRPQRPQRCASTSSATTAHQGGGADAGPEVGGGL